jgi:Amt family ammonium transporter
MVETGFTRAKNAAHTATMNFMVYGVAMIAYWAVGFAIQAGGVGTLGGLGTFEGAKEALFSIGGKDWGLFGTQGFFLTGVAYTAPVFAYFLFQMVFMDTTCTIPTGAMAERWAWKNFMLYGLWVALPYCIYANWVWGGGWLSQLGSNSGLGHGHVDFAGSSVVHMTGGVLALVTARLLGARRGKFNADGTVNVIPGHNIPMALFGTFVLCFGWFGFNAGSTLMGTDIRIGVIATNTMLAGAAGSITAMRHMISSVYC